MHQAIRLADGVGALRAHVDEGLGLDELRAHLKHVLLLARAAVVRALGSLLLLGHLGAGLGHVIGREHRPVVELRVDLVLLGHLFLLAPVERLPALRLLGRCVRATHLGELRLHGRKVLVRDAVSDEVKVALLLGALAVHHLERRVAAVALLALKAPDGVRIAILLPLVRRLGRQQLAQGLGAVDLVGLARRRDEALLGDAVHALHERKDEGRLRFRHAHQLGVGGHDCGRGFAHLSG